MTKFWPIWELHGQPSSTTWNNLETILGQFLDNFETTVGQPLHSFGTTLRQPKDKFETVFWTTLKQLSTFLESLVTKTWVQLI